MLKETQVRVETKYTPTFTKGDVVALNKDCCSQTITADNDDPFFKKGCICVIEECGLAHFFENKKGEPPELLKDGEWCMLNVIIEDSKI